MDIVGHLIDEVDLHDRAVRLLGLTVTNPVDEEVRRGPIQLTIQWPDDIW